MLDIDKLARMSDALLDLAFDAYSRVIDKNMDRLDNLEKANDRVQAEREQVSDEILRRKTRQEQAASTVERLMSWRTLVAQQLDRAAMANLPVRAIMLPEMEDAPREWFGYPVWTASETTEPGVVIGG